VRVEGRLLTVTEQIGIATGLKARRSSRAIVRLSCLGLASLNVVGTGWLRHQLQ